MGMCMTPVTATSGIWKEDITVKPKANGKPSLMQVFKAHGQDRVPSRDGAVHHGHVHDAGHGD
eukprot:CAMPEP_0177189628 /NCGR_PEP_ID=MMETSP0367-20130122/20372_1 /TAXON_ID=447022 ORGANISM="Scrippsiella hangoei-like, Strain SHHI-4" /NCGR_SAMPLE_ID=MMETSP0367 /ASSEMBLY_ACC=CAM_ASM_000362 /LENGTH=62 /DNA_ID=CAMNT_0018637183 /DNA_START=138 /DNA_END=323 /DNA_ORIENTATION=-